MTEFQEPKIISNSNQAKPIIYWIALLGYVFAFIIGLQMSIIFFKLTLSYDPLNQSLNVVALIISLIITIFMGITVFGLYRMKQWARKLGITLSVLITINLFLHLLKPVINLPLGIYLVAISGIILLFLKNFN